MDQHPQQSQRNHHDSYSSSPMPYGAHPQIMDHNSDAFEFNGSSSSAPVSIGSTGVMSSSMQQPILVSSPEVLGLLNTPMPIDNHHHHQNQHASTLHAPPPPVSIPGNPAAEQMAAQAQAQAEAAVAAAVAAAAHQPMGMSLDSTSLDHLLQDPTSFISTSQAPQTTHMPLADNTQHQATSSYTVDLERQLRESKQAQDQYQKRIHMLMELVERQTQKISQLRLEVATLQQQQHQTHNTNAMAPSSRTSSGSSSHLF